MNQGADDEDAPPERSSLTDPGSASATASGHHRAAGSRSSTPGPKVLVALIVPIIALVVAQNIANATWPALVSSNPLGLLALSSINRYLVLTIPETDPWPYSVVGTLRLLAPDPFFFLIGWFYGPKGLAWLGDRFPTLMRSWGVFIRLFRKARYPAVFVAPNNAVCLLSGVDRMPVVPFAITNLAGTIARVVLIRLTGSLFESPLSAVVDLVARYRVPLLVISIAGVLLGVAGDILQRRARAAGPPAGREADDDGAHTVRHRGHDITDQE